MASWACGDRVADSSEERTRIEFGEGQLGIEAEGACASDSGGIGDSSRRSRIAIDAIGACAQDGEVFARVVCELKRAGKGELLISAACTGRARQGYGDFANGDEAEAFVLDTECVEALKQIAGCSGVVPVVATVVDYDMVAAGLLRQCACVFDEVVT